LKEGTLSFAMFAPDTARRLYLNNRLALVGAEEAV